MLNVSFALWAFVAGALIPVMGILNAGLARATGGPVFATVTLFAVGFGAALLLALVTSTRVPDLAVLARVPLAQYSGGLIVSFYVVSITFLAPRFGIGNAILFAVSAQLLTAAAIDHFAFAGAALRPLTPIRAIGLLVVVAGVAITQLGDRWMAATR
jgi:transporter family-2 protein